MNLQFDKKVVIVTGAAHGFGRAISLAFAQRGASVWACDVLADELAETQRLCQETRGSCEIEVVNVRDRAAVFAFVERALSTEGAVQILVNNAGGVQNQVGRPLEEVTEAQWDSIIEVNTRATFFFSQAVAPSMKAQAYGRIVNISSGAGLGPSLTGIQAYAAAKAGQINLTRQLAQELGKWQITVNNIAPGFVLSNPTSIIQFESYGVEGQKALLQRFALKRLGTAQDIAHGVLFFASDYANWITGQVLSIDGGR